MPCGWEGNRRSGVALAMRHKHKWFIHLKGSWPRQGDEHPAYALLVEYGSFNFIFTTTTPRQDNLGKPVPEK